MEELRLVAAIMAYALGVTVLVEAVVAVPFGLRLRGVAATVGINFITNPMFNLALLVLLFIAGSGPEEGYGTWDWVVGSNVIILEMVVVFAEWQLLVWALRGTGPSSRRLFVFSIVANAASAFAFVGLSQGL